MSVYVGCSAITLSLISFLTKQFDLCCFFSLSTYHLSKRCNALLHLKTNLQKCCCSLYKTLPTQVYAQTARRTVFVKKSRILISSSNNHKRRNEVYRIKNVTPPIKTFEITATNDRLPILHVIVFLKHKYKIYHIF